MLSEQATIDPGASLRRRLVLAVRVMLALGWLVWAVLIWWGSPREADVSKLSGDLAAGRVTTYSMSPWQEPRIWLNIFHSQQGGGDTMLVWETSDRRMHYIYPQRQIVEINDLTERLYRAGVGADGRGLAFFAQWLGAILGVTAFFILLNGPVPTRGTRPFWFWVGQIPFGLGFLAWLAWEKPWAQREDSRKKQNGYLGLAYLIIGSIAGSVLISFLLS